MNRRAKTVIDTFLPSGKHPELPHGAYDTGWDAFWEDYRHNAVPIMVVGMRLALWAAIWLAPLLLWKLPPITLYSRPTREEILEAMLVSRIGVMRDLGQVIKLTVSLHYGAVTEVRRAIRYPVDEDDSGKLASESPS